MLGLKIELVTFFLAFKPLLNAVWNNMQYSLRNKRNCFRVMNTALVSRQIIYQ